VCPKWASRSVRFQGRCPEWCVRGCPKWCGCPLDAKLGTLSCSVLRALDATLFTFSCKIPANSWSYCTPLTFNHATLWPFSWNLQHALMFNGTLLNTSLGNVQCYLCRFLLGTSFGTAIDGMLHHVFEAKLFLSRATSTTLLMLHSSLSPGTSKALLMLHCKLSLSTSNTLLMLCSQLSLRAFGSWCHVFTSNTLCMLRFCFSLGAFQRTLDARPLSCSWDFEHVLGLSWKLSTRSWCYALNVLWKHSNLLLMLGWLLTCSWDFEIALDAATLLIIEWASALVPPTPPIWGVL